MYWLNLDWILANWVPLLVFALLGFLLAWLVVAFPASRAAGAAQRQASDLEGKLRKSESALAELQKESEPLKKSLTETQAERDDALAKIAALEAAAAAAEQEKADMQTALEQEQQALEAQAAEAEEMLEDAAVAGEMEAIALMDEEMAAVAEVEEPEPEPEDPSRTEVADVFSAVARQLQEPSPSSKDIALSEAYARVSSLEHDLEVCGQALQQRGRELDNAQADLMTAQAAQKELESRLIRAREDVASELAVLASTMIKMKDDALSRAEARADALSAELETMRSAAFQATETAE